MYIFIHTHTYTHTHTKNLLLFPLFPLLTTHPGISLDPCFLLFAYSNNTGSYLSPCYFSLRPAGIKPMGSVSSLSLYFYFRLLKEAFFFLNFYYVNTFPKYYKTYPYITLHFLSPQDTAHCSWHFGFRTHCRLLLQNLQHCIITTSCLYPTLLTIGAIPYLIWHL